MMDQSTGSSKRFTGRRCIVAGGATGFGLRIAARLGAEGAALCLWDTDRDALAAARKAINPDVVPMRFDLSDWSAVDAAAISVRERFGGIDVLVCALDGEGPRAPLWTYPVEAWRRVVDATLNSVFHCNRAVVPHLLAGHEGRIVNLTSKAGQDGLASASAYCAGMAAIAGLSRALGKDLEGRGVGVASVAMPTDRKNWEPQAVDLVCRLASHDGPICGGDLVDVEDPLAFS